VLFPAEEQPEMAMVKVIVLLKQINVLAIVPSKQEQWEYPVQGDLLHIVPTTYSGIGCGCGAVVLRKEGLREPTKIFKVETFTRCAMT